MSQKGQKNSRKPGASNPGKTGRRFNWWLVYLVMIAVLLLTYLSNLSSAGKTITWQQFENDILDRRAVEKIVVVNNEKATIYIKKELADDPQFRDVFKTPLGTGVKEGPHYSFNIGSVESFERKMEEVQQGIQRSERIDVSYIKKRSMIWDVMGWVLPFVLLFFLWSFFFRRAAGMGNGPGGSSVFNFGRSTATLVEKEKSNVTFDDVAGLVEAEMEVREVVEFLKNPETFTRLGAKIPKGVILVGPPGTGKTLLAKAVAGEAQVPFFPFQVLSLWRCS